MPWGEIVKHVSDFLEPQFLPDRFAFTTPDHLKVKDCVSLLKHLFEREKLLGVGPDVFAWKAFVQKQKGGRVVAMPALISISQQDKDDATLLPRPRPRGKRKGKRKQPVQAPIVDFSDSGMDTPEDVDWRLADAHLSRISHSPSDSDDEESSARGIQDREFSWMPSETPALRKSATDTPESKEEDEPVETQDKRPLLRKATRPIVADTDDDEDYPPSNQLMLPRLAPRAEPGAVGGTHAAPIRPPTQPYSQPSPRPLHSPERLLPHSPERLSPCSPERPPPCSPERPPPCSTERPPPCSTERPPNVSTLASHQSDINNADELARDEHQSQDGGAPPVQPKKRRRQEVDEANMIDR